MKKRILSMLLAIFMVAGMLPTVAFAAETDNLCDHHTEHTADCGYAPAVEGSPCTHECGEECAEACTHVHDEACGYVEAAAEVPCGYVCEESHGEATRVIYVDESTFLASGYSRFYDADDNLLTATREEQEDGWVKYTMPADAKYYLTFDGHLGGGGGDSYPELPTDADRYDPSLDIWSCSHPGYAEGNCRLCGEPCPGHTYDNACDAECNVCSEIREVGDHVYDGAEDAECNECGYVRDITPVQITGVSITVDGDTYTSGNVTITPDSTVILTVTGTNLHNGSDDHRVDYASGVYQPVTPDYFEISEDGTVATYEPSTGDFAKSSNFEITYCNNDTDTANRTVVPTGIYLTYNDGIAEEDKAQITGMSITIDNVVYDSSNTSAEDPAVITPNTEFITITVHGTALQNCTTDHMVSYYSGSSQPILPDYLWHFEADGTSAYHYYSSASALSDFARNTTPYELQYSNNGSFNAANPAIGSGVYIVYDDSTGGEEPASCTCVTKCAEGSVNSECAVCSVEGADLSGCVGEEATADDEVKQTYAITVNASQNGSVIADEYAIEGDTVTLYVSPYLGYVLDTLSVTDAEGNAVTVENNKFTMPASAVTVSAAFVVCDHKDSQYKYYDNGDGYHDATCTACHDGSLEPHTIDSTTGECEKCGAKCTHNNFDSATGNCTDCVTPVAIAKVETGETTTYYQTAEELSTAVRSDLADPTITLLADFAAITDLNFNSDSEAKNTLDLNGHTIYSDYSARISVYCGELTITGTGSIDVFMAVDNEGAKIVVGSGVTLNDTLRSVYGGVLDLTNATIPEAGLKVILYTDDWKSTTYNVSDVLLLPEDYYFFVDGKVVSSYSVETEGTVLKHTEHSYTYTDNGDGTHDATCTVCGAVVEDEAHSGGTATCTELAECQHCGASYGEVDADAHGYGDWVSNGDDTHTRICANDSSHTENGDCSGGTATCTTLAVCDTCGASYGEVNANNHNWENGVCTYECGTTHDPHTFENGICTVCGKEDTTPAEITGVSIKVDGVTYTEGNVTITPETESIIVTVTGTNVAKLSGDHELDLGPGLTIFMNSFRWKIDSDANTATADFSDLNSEFGDHNDYEIMYSNGGGQGLTGTGIYLTYDDGTGGEEDTTPAEITGVSITVDGEEYVGSDTSAENPAVITSEAASVILTVHGTNLQYATYEQWVSYMSTGNCVTLDNSDWTKSEDGTLASLDMTWLADAFTQSVSVWEIKYSNDGGGLEDAVTGLYVKYEHIPEEEPIVIIQQPTDGEAKLGERYCVEVIAQGEGLKYQWYFRNAGASSFSKSSVTDSTYDDVMTTARMNRQVYCVITDSHGNSVTTDTASLIALKSVDLAITTLPESVTANYGERFTVTAEAVGDGVTYEWYYLDPDGASWLSANVRSATYSGKMSEKIDGRTVYCVATDIWGEMVATGTVRLSCERAELAITQQPNDASAKQGERFNVEVIAQGDGLKYQWYFRKVGVESWSISGVRDNTYDDVMTSARHNREVYCVITDAWGNSVTTDIATITAIPEAELKILAQPNDASAKLNEMFNVEVLAQGDGLKYQWYFRKVGVESWSTSGVRDNTYDDVMTSARHNREVYCVITDAWGNSVTTDIATISGIPTTTLAITKQPEDQTVPLGDPFCVTVEAVGDDLKYQWYFMNANADKYYVSGQRDNTYDDIMTIARHERSLYCVITDAWGNSVTTDPIVVIMASQKYELQILQQPNDASAKLGEEFCVTVEAQGDGLQYQWYYRPAGTETWMRSGVRDNTYDDVMTSARHNREVYCVITDMWGHSVTTDIALITGTPTAELAITQQPTDGTAALGETYCVTVEAQGDGLKYQWYFRQAGTTRWSKSGVTDNTYDDVMTMTRAGREVYCVITDAWGHSVTTEIVTLIRTDVSQAN